ncbi:MAG: two component transcriptional regulator, LuxR family [Dehalococcoidia bacterium]|nr:two component transcriptional regulator, LuxR family [Dehalococcoidia bacterium]
MYWKCRIVKRWNMGKIHVLIVDDHAMFREGLRALLAIYPDIEVVGEAADGREAIEKAHQLTPDIILMDIAMPGLGGLEATLELRRENSSSKIVVLTQHETKEYIFRFLKAGASGYVLKKAAGTDLVSAIRMVNEGGLYLHTTLATQVLAEYLGKPDSAGGGYETLTERERQVLKLIAEGSTNQEISDYLSLSIKTVMAHRANIMEKLGVHDRTELVKYAIRMGLIPLQMDAEAAK